MTNEQAQILKIAKTITSAFSSTLTQRATDKLIAPWGIHGRLQTLKAITANDNGAKMTRHLLDQLADIMAFTAMKKNADLAMMTGSLVHHFAVAKLSDLRDDQFSDALSFIFSYQIRYAV